MQLETRDMDVSMEIVLSFDTTLSMSDTIYHVRETAQDLINTIFTYDHFILFTFF